jgi:uncharacterized protein YndB with AHSA1/START domain
MMQTAKQEQAVKASVVRTGDREIRIERVFNASRDRVWEAWTDPALIAQWWGRGRKTVVERMEVKRGGHWRFVVHSNGREQGFEGRYREVTPKERFVWTSEWDGMPGYVAIDTVTFEDLGDGRTRLENTSLFFTAEECDGAMQSPMEEGLNDSYNALDALLASMG